MTCFPIPSKPVFKSEIWIHNFLPQVILWRKGFILVVNRVVLVANSELVNAIMRKLTLIICKSYNM